MCDVRGSGWWDQLFGQAHKSLGLLPTRENIMFRKTPITTARNTAADAVTNSTATGTTDTGADVSTTDNDIVGAPLANPAPARTSKIDGVIALLSRPDGATLGELVDATGWQPHSARAALTGLKNKGHAIARDKRGDASCYRITKSA